MENHRSNRNVLFPKNRRRSGNPTTFEFVKLISLVFPSGSSFFTSCSVVCSSGSECGFNNTASGQVKILSVG